MGLGLLIHLKSFKFNRDRNVVKNNTETSLQFKAFFTGPYSSRPICMHRFGREIFSAKLKKKTTQIERLSVYTCVEEK